MQMSNLGDVLGKLVYSNVPQMGIWAIFVSFWEKKAILIPLDHILRMFTAI